MSHPLGKLYVVATPIGNVADFSDRAKQILSQVTWVAAEDTRHSAGLLHALGISTELISYHEHNEHTRIVELIERLKKGEEGALISDAGTPLISDPGYGLIRRAHQEQIPVIPIPGPCSLIAALSVSGLPTDKFFFEGFLPAKSAGRKNRLEVLKAFAHTIIFLEAPHRIEACLQDLCEVFGGARQACVARELTKKYESVQLMSLADLLAAVQSPRIPQKGEFVLCVEGAPVVEQTAKEAEMQRVLSILLPELSLKQAVSVAAKLTGYSKNQLYDMAIQFK